MRALVRSTLLVAILLVASAAHAGPGVNLRWDHCYGDAGVQNKNFACDMNSGTETLVASFVLGSDVSTADGYQIVIDLVASAAALPAWWEFRNPGNCRQLGMNTSLGAASGACTGCSVPVCLLLMQVDVVSFDPNASRALVGPANGIDSNFATWQGGGTPVIGGQSGCPAALPTRQTNWGALKSLYR